MRRRTNSRSVVSVANVTMAVPVMAAVFALVVCCCLAPVQGRTATHDRNQRLDSIQGPFMQNNAAAAAQKESSLVLSRHAGNGNRQLQSQRDSSSWVVPSIPTPIIGSRRTGENDCTDNPVEYNVNVDIQIEFQDDFFAACDNQGQENQIGRRVQAALNDAFSTTVPDWQGSATFGIFHFDVDQEVNNVDPFGRARTRLLILQAGRKKNGNGERSLQDTTACAARDAVECNADYCRWGCLTATTTDCGTSSVTNWANLAEDIQSTLANLGFDCLGIPDQLQVVLQVDGSSANAGEGADDGDDNKTEEKEEEEADLSTEASVTRPSAATKSGYVADATADTTVTADDTTSSVKSGNGNGGGGGNEGAEGDSESASSCVDIQYTLNVDLQMVYPDNEYVACSSQDQENNIDSAISQALNQGFSTTVPDWDGQVEFGDASFDDGQDVSNANRRKRTLRGEAAVRRFLERGSCSARSIDCTADFCRWGCLEASASDCGTSSMTNWANLAEDIHTALVDLGYDCLGDLDQLQVNVLVEDPQASGDQEDDTITPNNAAIESPSTDNERSDTRLSKPNFLDEATNEDEAAADGPSRPLYIHSQLVFTFFEGQGREPSPEEIGPVEAGAIAFFTEHFKSDSRFGDIFQELQITQVIPKYDPSTPDEFTLEFLSTVLVDENAPVSAHQAAIVMASSRFKDYIREYVRESDANEFEQVFKVFFKGRTPKD